MLPARRRYLNALQIDAPDRLSDRLQPRRPFRGQRQQTCSGALLLVGVEKLDAVADRGYFNSEEIRACEEAGITVTLPKPMT